MEDSDSSEALPPDSNIIAADSIQYWNSIAPDVNGMLGGFPQISRVDLQGSKNFIAKLRRLNSNNNTSIGEPPSKKLKLGVDCGAGIGRITDGLLIHVCDVVDIVEPVEKFAAVLADGPLKHDGKVGDVYVEGLEQWQPSKSYDLIWNQWCVGHLTDAQLVGYLSRAAHSLTENGWIVLKENLSTQAFGEDLFDELDSSVTRSDQKFKELFGKANLDLVKSEIQSGFPKSLGLFPVKMYALRPR